MHQLRASAHTQGEHSGLSLRSAKGECSGFSLRSAKGDHFGLSLRSAKGYICFNIFDPKTPLGFLSFLETGLRVALAAIELSIDQISLKLKVIHLPLSQKSWN